MGAIDADVPYILNDLADRFRRKGTSFPMDALAANNMWVACENTDDLPYVLSHAGEDPLMIGTDYGHHDPSTELNAIHLLRNDKRITPAAVKKIRDKPEKLLRASMTGEIALKLRLSDTLEECIFPMHVTSKPRII